MASLEDAVFVVAGRGLHNLLQGFSPGIPEGDLEHRPVQRLLVHQQCLLEADVYPRASLTCGISFLHEI